jgi:hypothetical protein
MMSAPDPYLVFIYNADNGFIEALKDDLMATVRERLDERGLQQGE